MRVDISLAEDRCGFQEMDFIVKIKYQEGSFRLLDELENTEETKTGHLGHGTPLYILPRLSVPKPLWQTNIKAADRGVDPLFSWPMVAAHAMAIDNQCGSGDAGDASCGRRGSEAHIWMAVWEDK
jgi:hypothetical protein